MRHLRRQMRNPSGSAVLTKTEAVLLLCSLPLAISKRPTDCARPGFTVHCPWSTVTQTQAQPRGNSEHAPQRIEAQQRHCDGRDSARHRSQCLSDQMAVGTGLGWHAWVSRMLHGVDVARYPCRRTLAEGGVYSVTDKKAAAAAVVLPRTPTTEPTRRWTLCARAFFSGLESIQLETHVRHLRSRPSVFYLLLGVRALSLPGVAATFCLSAPANMTLQLCYGRFTLKKLRLAMVRA